MGRKTSGDERLGGCRSRHDYWGFYGVSTSNVSRVLGRSMSSGTSPWSKRGEETSSRATRAGMEQTSIHKTCHCIEPSSHDSTGSLGASHSPRHPPPDRSRLDIRSNLTRARVVRRCPCSSNSCALNFVVILSEWQRCSGERYIHSHLYEDPFNLPAVNGHGVPED